MENDWNFGNLSIKKCKRRIRQYKRQIAYYEKVIKSLNFLIEVDECNINKMREIRESVKKGEFFKDEI